MLGVRTDAGQGRYSPVNAPTEWDAVFATQYRFEENKSGAIWFHGNNQFVTADYTSYNAMFQTFAQSHHLGLADFGGSLFGNDVAIARTVEMVAYMESRGLIAPFVLIAGSMGASTALNYAVRNPAKVKAMALTIPVVSLSYGVDAGNPGLTNLNAAYGGTYDPNNPDHAAHDPLLFVDDLPADLPIKLWTSSNDPTVVPATHDAFVAARPQTERTVFGAYGHGGITVAAPDVATWIKQFA